ncbi:class I SAM-dependent methyltransferase [Candidatus Sulfidibacterium hydrothermale]|uniref:O-methyltransferase n=1 Tax=Candidatus Sulfidibacterium hydrothermale TaxID=2875962 RepID=UPI001F0B3061|nr:class I SAM-dependent methyltransferase [Candidatus Sulfidibacterium hydrothermale]UBM62851.1 class I SAM-dependent methyltransferase [Candidatus Sulfidibacterium hydrothermale]
MIRNKYWQIKSYIGYWFKAKTRYGVHSPFVYDLVEKVLKDRTEYPEYKKIEQYKKNISKSKTVIETVDFGARSDNKPYKETFEKVGDIVRKRSQRKQPAQLLFRLSRYFQPKNILEFGTAAGISTAYIKAPVPDSRMISMEGCASLADVASNNLKKLGIKNVEISVGEFDVTLPLVLNRMDQLDFVFFDGNHRYEPTLDYFNRCAEKAHEHTLFIFDDIHWSPGMEKAWEAIKNDARVTLTVDTFWLGLVFFRKGMEKQHFIIKY